MRGIAFGLILLSTSAMGFLVANSFSHRVYNLKQLITFIQVLESEIQFARTTLPNFITMQATQMSGDVGRFLTLVSSRLKMGTGESFGVVWAESLQDLASNGLPKSTLEDLKNLGDVLGTSDVTEQSKHLKVLLQRLDQALQIGEEEREKQGRLWQYLGFSFGCLICLLLL